MSTRERVMTIRLMEKLERDLEYAQHLGVEVVHRKAGKSEARSQAAREGPWRTSK